MKVLIPLDDSPSSERSLKELMRRQFPHHVQFKLLGVVEPLFFANEPHDKYKEMISKADEGRKKHYEHQFDKVRAQLHKHCPAAKVDCEIKFGNAADEIVDAAKEWHADKIIMGAHGRDSCPHNLPGSTSKTVARHAPCTVEILRGSEETASTK